MAIGTDQGVRTRRYSVGGVMLDRPFKVRRLGHFGFNLNDARAGLEFYRDLLGFAVSDPRDQSTHIADKTLLEGLGEADTHGYFMRYGSDHHSLVLSPTVMQRLRGRTQQNPEITAGQISWQVGSLAEVVNCIEWFKADGRSIHRSGRDMPGSNWHTYLKDPDGHTNELFYGMEQVGWEGRAKPLSMHDRRFEETPPLPQIGEGDEVSDALARGDRFEDGYRHTEALPRRYDVDGVLLARPFKVVGTGPVRLFVEDMEAAVAFYARAMGFVPTETVNYAGYEGLVLRCNNAHHVLGLYPKQLRAVLGLSPHTTTMSFGMRLATYEQLRQAVSFLASHGVQIRSLPPELSPGIDYAAYALDPDGHAIELYYTMEQLGSNGRPSPRGAVRRPDSVASWPETVEGGDDAYADEPFFGPWG